MSLNEKPFPVEELIGSVDCVVDRQRLIVAIELVDGSDLDLGAGGQHVFQMDTQPAIEIGGVARKGERPPSQGGRANKLHLDRAADDTVLIHLEIGDALYATLLCTARMECHAVTTFTVVLSQTAY